LEPAYTAATSKQIDFDQPRPGTDAQAEVQPSPARVQSTSGRAATIRVDLGVILGREKSS
jgi:hypothetical protein